MPSLISRNRSELKKDFSKILKLISVNDLDELWLAVDLIECDIFRYCLSRSLDPIIFQASLRGIRHSITHFRTPWRRTARLYEQVQELHNLFKKHEGSMSLQEKLKMISEDLTDDASRVFAVEEDFDPHVIFDDFDILLELSGEVKKQGYDTFQLFRQLVRNIGACKSFIPGRITGENLPRPQDLKSLKQNISPIFSILDDLISTFDEPIKPPSEKDKKKKENEGFELDLDEIKKEAIIQEAFRYIFKKGWTVETTSQHFNMTVPELLDLLDIDFGGEEEEEGKKKKDSDAKKEELDVEEKDNNDKSNVNNEE